MWKAETMLTKLKKLNELCGRSADSFHNMESTLWYFSKCGKYNLNFPYCGNYNVDFPLCEKNGLFHKTGSKISTMCKVNIELE